MSYGLQVWDSGGNLVLDSTNRISRLIGIYTINFPAGSVTTYASCPFWPYIWTSQVILLSTDYSELNGMTKASGQWSVASLSPDIYAYIVDIAGVGRVVISKSGNLNPVEAYSGNIAIFRY